MFQLLLVNYHQVERLADVHFIIRFSCSTVQYIYYVLLLRVFFWMDGFSEKGIYQFSREYNPKYKFLRKPRDIIKHSIRNTEIRDIEYRGFDDP